MANQTYNVLFLCTGNSARSIMAEAILNEEGKGRFHAYSAGSFPKGAVNPLALAELEKAGLPAAGLRSKSWDEFAGPGAPQMDFIFTLCDYAAGEVCPVWPGQPVSAHWGMSDPAAVKGDRHAVERAFHETFAMLGNRIRLFTLLPFERLDHIRLHHELRGIGQTA